MFEALAIRAEEEFGVSSIEATFIYYELGHALYLNVRRVSSVVVANDGIEEALEDMVKMCSILYSHVDKSISDGDDNNSVDGDTREKRIHWCYDIPVFTMGNGSTAKNSDRNRKYPEPVIVRNILYCNILLYTVVQVDF